VPVLLVVERTESESDSEVLSDSEVRVIGHIVLDAFPHL
jgi:hypothetical protein